MNSATQSREILLRHACLLGLVLAAGVAFHGPLWVVVASSIHVDQYSQILAVGPISVFLLYMERRKVFTKFNFSPVGALLYLASLAAYGFVASRASAIEHSNYISLSILLFSVSCMAAFLFCYGGKTFRAGLFPVLFLVLMTPLPDALREKIIALLQNGSAVATAWFFSAAGIPFHREGVVLTLPVVTIRIAEECSGIRSSMALLLVCLVFMHLFLKSGWAKLGLLLWFVPLTIIKNGVRIFTLCTLGMYVNRSFLTGKLHHEGGFVFFALAFAGLWAGVWLLEKLERKAHVPGVALSPQPSAPIRPREIRGD